MNARIILPKLTQVEHTLLFDNEGCLKCCKSLCQPLLHQMCQNGFPEAAGYQPLTQAFVDSVKCCTTRAMAILTLVDSNIPPIQPTAVILGVSTNPVMYMPLNVSLVIAEEGNSTRDSTVSPHYVYFCSIRSHHAYSVDLTHHTVLQ